MNAVFGPGNWTQMSYVNAQNMPIFVPSTSFVMLEGSDFNSSLPDYINNNISAIESWVHNGGHLFINAAPNYGADQYWGFDSTIMHYTPNLLVNDSDTISTIFPAWQIFIGPNLPTATTYTGKWSAHGYITGNDLIPLLYKTTYGVNNYVSLCYKKWGNGIVFFGACTQPYFSVPHPQVDNLWKNIFYGASHTIAAPIASAESNQMSSLAYIDCAGLHLDVYAFQFLPGMTVKTYFDNGEVVLTPVLADVSGGNAVVDHAFSTSGTYLIKQVLYNGTNAIDSVSFSCDVYFCNTFWVGLYLDENGNSNFDNNEHCLSFPVPIEVDSNDVPVKILSATSSFSYDAKGNAGDIYKFKVLNAPLGLHENNFVIDTLTQAGGIINLRKYLGFDCNLATFFDLSSHIVSRAGRHVAYADIILNNTYCANQSATLTMNFSPKYVYSSAFPAPTYHSGNTITWDFNSISAIQPEPVYIHVSLDRTGQYLVPGDTVHYHYNLMPIAGDTDASNNSFVIYDTVKGSFDPNEMQVSPQGNILAGTKLQYSIEFENDGNDTAQNIYVLDTLPAGVDANSLHIVAATAVMSTIQYDKDGYNIVKFDFPNIKLLDSTHHDQCTGMVIFTVDAKQGLPDGTTIDNKAGIYFDDAEVVMTNGVENIIGIPTLVGNIGKGIIVLYPNPATNQLIISADEHLYHSFTIANSMGQLMMQDEVRGTNTTINVKLLPAGIYYITFSGASGNEVRKFVKM
jgi:uncharacterized repeat protein (TIGR01451 family)